MGLVLLFFNGNHSSALVVISVLVLVIPITTYFIIKTIFQIIKQNQNIIAYIIFALVLIATIANIILAVSLEPLYYKINYISLLAISTFYTIWKLNQKKVRL